MVEIFGKEACGKTTLALHIIREAQKRGGTNMSFTLDEMLKRKRNAMLSFGIPISLPCSFAII